MYREEKACGGGDHDDDDDDMLLLLRTILSATYATPQNIQQFYMQQPNILSKRFMQFIVFLMMGE
jgi:hypothetical protein